MAEIILGALFIMCLRIIDVSLATVRTLMIMQGRVGPSGAIGFVESTVWVIAISYVVQHLNNPWNILGYASGFAIGNMLGIVIEKRIGIGFIQTYIVSLKKAGEIAELLRKKNFGVTKLPGEGSSGNVSILMVLTLRRRQKELMSLIDHIDHTAFVSVNSATPSRGYMQRK
ncbi:MAG: DUF2179 domain-containing protein [Ignavibacteriae bacterium]|nr:DUF2179 domain-containing protein [Ignavibacteriota bacterium]MCB9243392.1 DUF2179 domain-containing protein [Ignavibacteriales bacterium]